MTALNKVNAQIEALGWKEARSRGLRWFVADVARSARMIRDPEAIEIDLKIEDDGRVNVLAKSKLYYAVGCCVIGPRGGIKHRVDRRDINI